MIEHRHFFKKIKGASEETPLRSPMRAIHLRLADYQKTIRKGRKVQTYSGTINKGSRPGAESNKFCRVDFEAQADRLLGPGLVADRDLLIHSVKLIT